MIPIDREQTSASGFTTAAKRVYVLVPPHASSSKNLNICFRDQACERTILHFRFSLSLCRIPSRNPVFSIEIRANLRDHRESERFRDIGHGQEADGSLRARGIAKRPARTVAMLIFTRGRPTWSNFTASAAATAEHANETIRVFRIVEDY